MGKPRLILMSLTICGYCALVYIQLNLIFEMSRSFKKYKYVSLHSKIIGSVNSQSKCTSTIIALE